MSAVEVVSWQCRRCPYRTEGEVDDVTYERRAHELDHEISDLGARVDEALSRLELVRQAESEHLAALAALRERLEAEPA